MNRMLQVARREITQIGGSKAYLITSGLILIGVVALILIPTMLSSDTTEYTVGLVGDGNQEIVAAAEVIATAGDDPDSPPSVEITTTDYADRDSATAALETGEVDAILIDGSEVVVEAVGFNPPEILYLLQRGAAAVELEKLVVEAGETATEVIALLTSDPLETTSLREEDDTSGTGAFIAYAGLMLLYLAVLIYGNWILTGVTEEKSSRVVEVLLATVKPWQLLGGKILGIGSLGLLQFLVVIIAALIGLKVTNLLELPELPLDIATNLLVWFVLGFLVFAAMFATAGSLVSRTEDAQSMALPISMVAVAGFLASISALEDPFGTVAVVATFLPITAPFVVPVRAALDALPVWQYAAAVVITVVSIVLLVMLAGRIYRGSALRVSGKTKLREAWRAAAE